MASQQGGHPSKLKTCLLPLTGRLCRPKWQVISGSWDAKLCNVHTKKNYLLAILSFVRSAEGDRTTSPSFENTNGPIDASSSSLEAQMARCFLQLVCKVGHFTHKKFYLLANRSFLRGAEGDRETSPIFTAENESIDVSSSSLEAPSTTHHIGVGCKREQFHNGKQIPVCRSFVIWERRGRRGNVALSCN